MTGSAFALEDVTVRFNGLLALERITLQIEAREIVAFVGPSGSGKTTLLRLLNGSVRPTSGLVAAGGHPLASMNAADLRRLRASIGFIHQDLRLVPNLRVVQNVVAGRLGRLSILASLRAVFLTPHRLAVEAHAILERVGIPEKLYERTDRLSGGQRQRVAIARALFQQPVALLADEPVSSVDPARARDAVQLLTKVARELGLTLCVSLHNIDLAREFLPRLIGLRRGQIVFDTPASGFQGAMFDDLYRLEAAEMTDHAS
jgi:phosphonate transport system ATP-binding protein